VGVAETLEEEDMTENRREVVYALDALRKEARGLVKLKEEGDLGASIELRGVVWPPLSAKEKGRIAKGFGKLPDWRCSAIITSRDGGVTRILSGSTTERVSWLRPTLLTPAGKELEELGTYRQRENFVNNGEKGAHPGNGSFSVELSTVCSSLEAFLFLKYLTSSQVAQPRTIAKITHTPAI
jgi:hypothetical protein